MDDDIAVYLNVIRNNNVAVNSPYRRAALLSMRANAEGLLRHINKCLGYDKIVIPGRQVGQTIMRDLAMFKCPDCTYEGKSEQGLNSHRGKKHKLK